MEVILNLRVKQEEQTVDLIFGKGGKEMLVLNYKLHLTLKLRAKMLFSFFPGSSVAVRVCTASVPLCLVFPSVL